MNDNVIFNVSEGTLTGRHIIDSSKSIGQLEGVFANEKARREMDQSLIVYRVQAYLPVPDGTTAGLFFGTTRINPGKVGDEYFMTHGHFHQLMDRAEYYWCLKGKGMLILMNEGRHCYAEPMHPGSLHYIPANTAHRVANTGDETLVFSACWPSDAGHNYEEVRQKGFSKRLFDRNNIPTLE
ncbi:MAG TPA: glucose-6-phosphate isomerase family protein [Puia sp.]|nr:glucose-6-phosphate isomerase family protein [Puia sp.]